MSDGTLEGTYQYKLDGTEPPSAGVYSTIAVLEDCPPLALSPLAETLDPDALDDLFGRGRPTSVEVTFTYCGYEVTVTSRSVRVEERDGQ